MIFLYLHAGFMLTALLFLLVGAAVAIRLRRKRWWVKVHRRLGIGGASTMAAGYVAANLLVSSLDHSHFGFPHTWVGGLTMSGVIFTLTLGFGTFRFPARAVVIRRIHRWSGRITLVIAVITILSGLFLADVF